MQTTTPSQKECRPGSVFVRQIRFSSDTLSGTEGVQSKLPVGLMLECLRCILLLYYFVSHLHLNG
jgi:hypothetical protein